MSYQLKNTTISDGFINNPDRVYFHEYFEKNSDKALKLDRSSFYEKFVDNPDYIKRDLKRINLVNLNIGGILISLIIIFLNELRQNINLKFNRKKK